MGAGEHGQPDTVGVLGDRGLDDLLRGLVQPGVDDLHAGIAQRAGNNLGATVVAIQARLGDYHSNRCVRIHVPSLAVGEPARRCTPRTHRGQVRSAIEGSSRPATLRARTGTVGTLRQFCASHRGLCDLVHTRRPTAAPVG